MSYTQASTLRKRTPPTYASASQWSKVYRQMHSITFTVLVLQLLLGTFYMNFFILSITLDSPIFTDSLPLRRQPSSYPLVLKSLHLASGGPFRCSPWSLQYFSIIILNFFSLIKVITANSRKSDSSMRLIMNEESSVPPPAPSDHCCLGLTSHF